MSGNTSGDAWIALGLVLLTILLVVAFTTASIYCASQRNLQLPTRQPRLKGSRQSNRSNTPLVPAESSRETSSHESGSSASDEVELGPANKVTKQLALDGLCDVLQHGRYH